MFQESLISRYREDFMNFMIQTSDALFLCYLYLLQSTMMVIFEEILRDMVEYVDNMVSRPCQRTDHLEHL